MTDKLAVTSHSRRDFWLCLARAFGQPQGDEFHHAFSASLADDLEAISEEIGLMAGEDIAALRRDAAAIGAPIELLRLYSKLFLTPPAPVMLNTGFYMEGGKTGQIEQELRAFIARHGLQKSENLRDFHDTVPLQLEMLAFLHARAGDHAMAGKDIEARAYLTEADAFIARYPARWITPFLRDLEKACSEHGLNRSYEHLGRILWLAVEQARGGAKLEALPAGAGLPPGSARGIGKPSAEDLAEIAYRLEQAGLTWDHVAANEGWDDAIFAARRARGDAEEGAGQAVKA
jgi:TorA maturation chaperone TorD